MSPTASLLFLVVILMIFVGVIALLVVLLDRFFGELIRSAWDEIDRRPADRPARDHGGGRDEGKSALRRRSLRLGRDRGRF
jgi:hypothetical protein